MFVDKLKKGSIVKKNNGEKKYILINTNDFDDRCLIGYISNRTNKFETEVWSINELISTDDFYDIELVDSTIRDLLV